MDHLEFLIPISLFAVIGWIVHIIVTSGRLKEQVRATAEFRAKVLEKMTSTKEFGEFLETDGGRRFMSTLTTEGPSAKVRIVKSTENGIICLAIGIAMLLLAGWFEDGRQGMTVFGAIITACGIGFLVSCVSSYVLSKNLGLFDAENGSKRS